MTGDDCLYCGYSRAGIDATAPCPECGTSPPSPERLVLQGTRFGVPAAFSGTLLALTLAVSIAIVATALRAMPGGTLGTAFIAVPFSLIATACALTFAKLRRGESDYRNRRTWVFGERELEIIDGGKRVTLAYDKIAQVERRLGVTLRAQVVAIERVPFIAVDRKIYALWLRDRRVAKRAAETLRTLTRAAAKTARERGKSEEASSEDGR